MTIALAAVVAALTLGELPRADTAKLLACREQCVRANHPCHAPHRPGPCREPEGLQCGSAGFRALYPGWCEAAERVSSCQQRCVADVVAVLRQEAAREDASRALARNALLAELDTAQCDVDERCRADREYRRQQEEARRQEEERQYQEQLQREAEEREQRHREYEEAQDERRQREAQEDKEYREQLQRETDEYNRQSWQRTQDSVNQSQQSWKNQMDQINRNVQDAQRRQQQQQADQQRRQQDAQDRQRQRDEQRAADQRRRDELRERQQRDEEQRQQQLREQQARQRDQQQREQQREQERQQREAEKQAAEQRERACVPASTCLGVGKVGGNVGYCAVNKLGRHDFLPVFKNSCAKRITCRICGRGSDSHCVEWEFPAGDSLGGWGSDFTWCDIDRVEWKCAEQLGNSAHCVKGFR